MGTASVCVSVLTPGFTGDLEFVMTPFSDLTLWQAAVNLAALQIQSAVLANPEAIPYFVPEPKGHNIEDLMDIVPCQVKIVLCK